jgi:hypothetical protein
MDVGQARISHHPSTAAAHLRTLTRDFGVRLLDVPTGTPPGPNPEISRQSTNLHALATRRGEKSGLALLDTRRSHLLAKQRQHRLAPRGEGEALTWSSRGGGDILVPEWPGDRAGQGSFGKCRTAQTVPDIVAGLHLAQTISDPVSMQSRLRSPSRQIPR